jgi:DNA adenine methylase
MSAQYFGSKASLAKWICNNLPTHTTYIEPFAGSGAVLLQKQRCQSEQLNDLNQSAINYLYWLQSDVAGLVDNIHHLQPDYTIALPTEDQTIASAAFFYLYSQLSFMGGGTRWSTGASTNGYRINTGHLWQDSQRLQGIKLTRHDAFEVIEQVSDTDTLLYVDPPYLGSVRKSKDNRTANPIESMPRRQYAYELLSEDEHRRLGEVLHRSPAMVVLSGFPSSLYESLFEVQGWAAASKRVNGGVERLWLNPAVQKRLPQLSLLEVAA